MNLIDFLHVLQGGGIEANGSYSISEPIVLDASASGKTFDLKNASVKISAEGKAAIRVAAEGITLKNARLTFVGGVGISVEASDCLIEACEITGADTGIMINSHDVTASACKIAGCEHGIVAGFKGSEISACMADGYNILLARNELENATDDISIKNASNAAVVMNRCARAEIVGGVNAYIIENTVSGELILEENNYLIANGNNAGVLTARANSNENGDNVTDLSERAEIGVNSKLLPHLNRELFVGMERKSGVHGADGVKSMYQYITENAVSGTVIIPPGAYSARGMTFDGVNGLKIYAYGVLHEQDTPNETAVMLNGCTDVHIKGMFFGHSVYPHTQGTVVYRDDEKTCFVTDPGYRNNFSDSQFFGGGAPGFFFKPNLLYPECDFLYKKKEYDAEKNWNILTQPAKKIDVGDRVAFRTGFSAGAVHPWQCSGVLLEDVTVFSCSGFAESDKNNDIAPVLHRFAVAAGPAPLLEGTEADYKGSEGVVHRDIYGRLRSAEPLNTSCDATHCTNARHGIQIISCLLERMNDDGGNINAFYGLAQGFEAQSCELSFGRCNSRSYRYLPAPVKAGDRLLVYSFSGRLLGDVHALNDAQSEDGDNFTVKISEPLVLPEGENVAVQNASASGNGFLIDNTLVRDEGCNGFRIKAIGGEVRNSSFIGLSKGALDCVPEFQLWPECGYASDVKIVKNRFERLGKTSNLSEDSEACAWCAPINIRYSLWDRGANTTPDPSYCLHKRIEISDNEFINSYSRYEIAISAASDVCIRHNRFEFADENIDKKYPLLLFGGKNIEFGENTFSDNNGKRVEYRFGTEPLSDLSGNNLQ